ncbi:hypothetical protein BOTBODRAFT_36749 [Botryobasidium botryosum FD-172 SS1]|uniref:Uncharacterized protein n=1 Tax=Botryobasidium botryosum (strain FD-172 SS1) TaxID=930990 RepID=A0A067MED7_BOTB1|nr:hypothetical protein BOTBODRAFT_36749 [Botryobasidium botryosum FD-172 SS1]
MEIDRSQTQVSSAYLCTSPLQRSKPSSIPPPSLPTPISSIPKFHPLPFTQI